MSKKVLVVFMFLFASVMLFSFGGKEEEVPVTTQVTGMVRLVGTSLFQELVITGREHVWYVVSEEAGKLIDMQYKTVTVEGEETVREIQFANGRSAGTKRELRNIRIISTE